MSRIIVLGDLIIDEYLIGKCTRISPEAPVPVVQYEKTRSFIGGAGNVHNNILNLEGESFFIGCTGRKSALNSIS